MNLNELAYRLKEQGLSYIQIGFVLKDREERKELCSALSLGIKSGQTEVMDAPITIPPRLANSPVSGA